MCEQSVGKKCGRRILRGVGQLSMGVYRSLEGEQKTRAKVKEWRKGGRSWFRDVNLRGKREKRGKNDCGSECKN